MKKLWFIVVPLLAAIGWLAWRAADAGRPAAVDTAPIAWKGAPPTLTLNDAEEIFKKSLLAASVTRRSNPARRAP